MAVVVTVAMGLVVLVVLVLFFLNGNGENMTIQQYLMINESTNVVDNICVWDGDINTWQPPADTLMLVQADIQAYIWTANYTTNPYSWGLTLQLGVGGIGFTWDGTYLTTNQPRPTNPPTIENPAPNQPTTSGTTTI